MLDTICPLCRRSEIEVMEVIRANDLNNIYLETYHFEIMYLFKNDEISFCICKNCGLKFFDPSAVGDEYFYNVLQKTNLYYMENKEEYDFAARYVSPSDDILDIGCGKGAFSKKTKYQSFTGLEFSSNAKEIGEQLGVRILNQSIQEHSIENKGKYDAVCTFQVLEHVSCDELFDFLKTAVYCVKENGLFIISVPSDDSYLSKSVSSPLNLPPHHQTRWSDKTLKEIGKIFHLEIIDLHHDALAPRNRAEYLSINVKYLLTKKHSIVYEKINLLQKIALKLTRTLNDKIRLTLIKKIKPYGHSVTVVYKKKFPDFT